MCYIFIKAFQAPIRLYIFIFSPLLRPSCRFSPTCSAYALEALEKHGVLKGLFLGMRRILRCNPYCKCDFHDPVPESLNWSIDWRRAIGYKRGANETLGSKRK